MEIILPAYKAVTVKPPASILRTSSPATCSSIAPVAPS
jgi:hypothetical protein